MVLSAVLGAPAYLTPAVNGFQKQNETLGLSAARLASGNRIQNIGDDVAGISMAAQFKTQLASLRQANSNLSEGISLLQVAADGLQQISDILSTLSTLATQATSASLTTQDRGFLQQQFADTLSQIDPIATDTTFNDKQLLDGTLAAGSKFQVGPTTNDTITVAIASVTKASLFAATPDIGSVANATAAVTSVTNASNSVQSLMDKVTGLQNGFTSATGAISQSIGGTTESHNDLAYTDAPAEFMKLMQEKLNTNAATAILAQAIRLQSGLLTALKPIQTQSAPVPIAPRQSTTDAAQSAA